MYAMQQLFLFSYRWRFPCMPTNNIKPTTQRIIDVCVFAPPENPPPKHSPPHHPTQPTTGHPTSHQAQPKDRQTRHEKTQATTSLLSDSLWLLPGASHPRSASTTTTKHKPDTQTKHENVRRGNLSGGSGCLETELGGGNQPIRIARGAQTTTTAS